jgi:hypothetical protein
MVDSCRRADKGKVVVCKLQLCVVGIHFVDEERYCFILLVALD